MKRFVTVVEVAILCFLSVVVHNAPQSQVQAAANQSWIQEQKIASDLNTTGDQRFGEDVSLVGSQAAIGARFDDGEGLSAGAA